MRQKKRWYIRVPISYYGAGQDDSDPAVCDDDPASGVPYRILAVIVVGVIYLTMTLTYHRSCVSLQKAKLNL